MDGRHARNVDLNDDHEHTGVLPYVQTLLQVNERFGRNRAPIPIL